MQHVPENTDNVVLPEADTGEKQSGSALALVTIIGIIVYVVIDVVAQLLPPHYNAITQPESDLAVGPYGFLMTINFVIRGVLSLALLIGLTRALSKEGRSEFGRVLLSIWSVGAFLLALFPTDIAGQKLTLHGLIHLLVAFIAFVSVAVGELLLSLRFAADERWQTVRNPTVTIAFVTLIALFLLFFGTFAGLNGIGGLLERVFLGLALLWILVVALHLHSLTAK
ncbi:MAG TPA: DUF998 domain-containing protein [Ktedonobacteraceae bacterium]|nr:DUF998 domain-containing protein [Ktedonobacteraceae bacterium]